MEGGETLWPARRFLPAASGGRWLRSSEIRVAVARDLVPSFGGQDILDYEPYTVASSVELTLPQARSGDGELTYSLAPVVPGLTFDPQLRRLSGTPTRAGTYPMVYRVQDADGDEDTLRLTIDVNDARALGMGGDDSMDDGDAMMGGVGVGGFPQSGGGPLPPAQAPQPSRDTTFVDNPRTGFVAVAEDAISTFSLDVDRTSYFLALNWAKAGHTIDPASVRAEEWINAFDFGYDPPDEDDRFAITTALLEHPTADGLHLARIGFRAPIRLMIAR